jgi:hypothetical protein
MHGFPISGGDILLSRSQSTLISNDEAIRMMHVHRLTIICALGAAIGATACSKEQQATVDTTAGAAATAVGTALSVVDIDMGRRIDAEQKISDKTDDFAPTDTIFASVHTSGTANNGAVVGRWTSQDGAVLEEKTNMVTTSGDARTVFSLVKPAGLAAGKYTLHVLIDGKEVRTKDVTVK